MGARSACVRHTRPTRHPEESDAVNLIWEGALEAARLARFPDAVSRLDCVFAWFREEEAQAFRDRFRPDHKVYRVELIDPDTPVTIADHGAITDAEAGPYVEMAARMAVPYWNPTLCGRSQSHQRLFRYQSSQMASDVLLANSACHVADPLAPEKRHLGELR
jgi:hypothetical protein